MSNISKPYQASADLFKIMSHPARLTILSVLRDGEQCVCHIEAMLKMRQAYISQHLKILKDANIVSVRRDGWNMYYHVIFPEIFMVIDAMFTLSGQPDSFPHVHANPNCPCPKCHPGSVEVASAQNVISNQ